MPVSEKKSWFESWFNTEYYHILYVNRSEEEARVFIKNLSDFLPLLPGSRVLDIACGKGRHSVQLNKEGYEVWGIDLAEESIKLAKKRQNTSLHFEVHDMRQPFKTSFFDCVMNLFTSFGYFENEGANEKALAAIAANIKPGGFFVLDYLNVKRAVKDFPKQETVKRKDICFDIKKECVGNKIVKHISFDHDEKQFRFKEQLFYLEQGDFKKLFATVQLEIVAVLGNYQLEAFNIEKSPRLILIAQKRDA